MRKVYSEFTKNYKILPFYAEFTHGNMSTLFMSWKDFTHETQILSMGQLADAQHHALSPGALRHHVCCCATVSARAAVSTSAAPRRRLWLIVEESATCGRGSGGGGGSSSSSSSSALVKVQTAHRRKNHFIKHANFP